MRKGFDYFCRDPDWPSSDFQNDFRASNTRPLGLTSAGPISYVLVGLQGEDSLQGLSSHSISDKIDGDKNVEHDQHHEQMSKSYSFNSHRYEMPVKQPHQDLMDDVPAQISYNLRNPRIVQTKQEEPWVPRSKQVKKQDQCYEEEDSNELKGVIPNSAWHFNESKISSDQKYEDRAIRGKYKILSEEFKREIVEETRTRTVIEVSKKYGVSVNNICRWRKRCNRRAGAGRKVNDISMEKALLDWIDYNSSTLSRKAIQNKAKELAIDSEFKASKGWFERFLKRNKLCLDPKLCLNHNLKLQHRRISSRSIIQRQQSVSREIQSAYIQSDISQAFHLPQ